MTVYIPQHDESLMPMILCSPARTPEYGLQKWSIKWDTPEEYKKVLEAGEDQYAREWGFGTGKQKTIVAEASKRAGFGDNAQTVRDYAAKAVAYLAKHRDGELVILDHGSGPGLSTRTIFNALDDNDKDRAHMILLDTSRDYKEDAAAAMQKLGASYTIVADTDMNILQHVQQDSVDIFTGVASLHHHPHIPFELFYQVLKKGGFLVSSDWHNSVWEEPYRVYKMLERFDWTKKEDGIRHFLETYPLAKIPVPEPVSQYDCQANEDIIGFWFGYYSLLNEAGSLGNNEIWPLEGHRPVERYARQMSGVGFDLDSAAIREMIESGAISANPHQIKPESRMLMLTIGQKT